MPGTVTIWFGGGRRDVPAFPTPVPGVVIHAGIGPDAGSWCVVHAASGAGVLKLPDPEAALHAALCLGGLADWLLPGTALRALPGLKAAVERMARLLGCYTQTFTGGVVTDVQLASTETATPIGGTS